MKINRTYAGAAVVLLAACAALVFLYTPERAAAPQTTQLEAPQAGSISLSVQGLYTTKQVAVTSDETVLQVLQTINATDSQLQLVTKEYTGLGTLVTGMHGTVNGTDKKYWQYHVNGVLPLVGADAYKLKAGERVEWLFDVSQE